MVVISWKDCYTVHVESIDNQHKTIMRLINDLYHILTEGTDQDVDQAISELSVYTKEHFEYEESFLKKYHYPFFDAHQEEHLDFFRSVERIKKEMVSLGKTGRKRLIDFMVNWLQNHIVNEDRQYISFMLKHGIK